MKLFIYMLGYCWWWNLYSQLLCARRRRVYLWSSKINLILLIQKIGLCRQPNDFDANYRITPRINRVRRIPLEFIWRPKLSRWNCLNFDFSFLLISINVGTGQECRTECRRCYHCHSFGCLVGPTCCTYIWLFHPTLSSCRCLINLECCLMDTRKLLFH